MKKLATTLLLSVLVSSPAFEVQAKQDPLVLSNPADYDLYPRTIGVGEEITLQLNTES